jgi:hypothetical protein
MVEIMVKIQKLFKPSLLKSGQFMPKIDKKDL